MWGAHFDTDIAYLLAMKPKGVFHVEHVGDRMMITVHKAGEPAEVIPCLNPAHANRLRQQFSDDGLTGFVEGGL